MHFIISDQVGLLKELTITEPNKSKVDTKTGLVAQKQAASYGKVDRDMEITSMHRSFDTLKNQIFLGRKSGGIDVFDIDSKVIQPVQVNKNQCQSKVIGLYHHDDQQRLFVLRQSGEFSVSSVDEHLQSSALFSKNLGQDLCALDVCSSQSSPNLVVYGGKERDVTVFDIEAQDTCFKGKNVAHDWLDMRVPLHHAAVKFMPNSDQEIVTCTLQGTVKLYDMRQDRCPVLTEAIGGKDIALKKLSIVGGNNNSHPHNERREILVCDNVGDVYHYDLGERRVIGKLKGSAGAIYDAQTFTDSSDNQKLKVATVGLDRFLRVYDLKSRTLLHKVYMKQRMNQVITIIDLTSTQNEQKSKDCVDRDIDGSEYQYSDLGSDNDDVWKQLEVVNEKVKKKRTQ
ncbi:hypothetical protein MIR68_000058 [Amoeboaphelidium protococcarum]|nr:hypothetical protein MIR68_000058 [Amoeboaphelidium protococcarum]